MGPLNFRRIWLAAVVLTSLTAFGAVAAVARANTALPRVPTSLQTPPGISPSLRTRSSQRGRQRLALGSER
jgi:hypothetical protein